MKDYDLMVEEEEQIAFVLAENVPGTITEKVRMTCFTEENSVICFLYYVIQY